MEDKKHTGFILVDLCILVFFLISLSSGEKNPNSEAMR